MRKEKIMVCEHKTIKSVNCVLYCAECGLKLPDGWLNKDTTNKENAQETPPKASERKKRSKSK